MVAISGQGTSCGSHKLWAGPVVVAISGLGTSCGSHKWFGDQLW